MDQQCKTYINDMTDFLFWCSTLFMSVRTWYMMINTKSLKIWRKSLIEGISDQECILGIRYSNSWWTSNDYSMNFGRGIHNLKESVDSKVFVRVSSHSSNIQRKYVEQIYQPICSHSMVEGWGMLYTPRPSISRILKIEGKVAWVAICHQAMG